jgi:hypothetical protein
MQLHETKLAQESKAVSPFSDTQISIAENAGIADNAGNWSLALSVSSDASQTGNEKIPATGFQMSAIPAMSAMTAVEFLEETRNPGRPNFKRIADRNKD